VREKKREKLQFGIIGKEKFLLFFTHIGNILFYVTMRFVCINEICMY
jgi:hypothetical protein